MLTDTTASPYAKAVPLPSGAVRWTEGFYKTVEEQNAQATVPLLLSMFEDKDISHILENFRICAGEAEGHHDGTVFGDGDFYKWMEAACYVASARDDEALWERIEEYIGLIGRAQQPDGYLSTKQILGERDGNGVHRMGDINDFEVYNFGHMFTAAALHYRLTGRRSFLSIAEKTADYLDGMYAEALKKQEVQTAVCPSHYMGLIELYRATGDEKYLRLARTAIELRDSVKNGLDDNQDRLPLRMHRKIIGHAVRANYLYAGLADLYLEEGDPDYLTVLNSVMEDLTEHKLYLTGGCGALYNGASPYGNFFSHQLIHQAYGYAYQLPNLTAYNETCAGVGLILWAYRMFLIDPRASYFDLIERALLNTSLAAVSLDGLRFFYENMLERSGKLEYELVWPLHRTGYITSYCCPPNLARLLAQTPEYAYVLGKNGQNPAQSGEPAEADGALNVYIGLYGASRTALTLPDGTKLVLVQETDYPFDGRIRFHAEQVTAGDGCGRKASAGAGEPVKLRIFLRIPGWADQAELEIRDGQEITKKNLSAEKNGSFSEGSFYEAAEIRQIEDFLIELKLEMPARLTMVHPMAEEDRGRAALERGPLVYCLEQADLPEEYRGQMRGLRFAADADFVPETTEIEGRQLTALSGNMLCTPEWEGGLYRTLRPAKLQEVPVRLIPYFAWNNRRPEEDEDMAVFFPVNYR